MSSTDAGSLTSLSKHHTVVSNNYFCWTARAVTDHPTIRSSRPDDLAPVIELLEASELPTVGVLQWLPHYLVAEVAGASIVGAGGLEFHAPDAVLRSLVVASGARGRGTGDSLVGRLIEVASTKGVRDLYLLTTTAEDYFRRRGFEVIGRNDVSDEASRSVEFQGACPDSAVVMKRTCTPFGELNRRVL